MPSSSSSSISWRPSNDLRIHQQHRWVKSVVKSKVAEELSSTTHFSIVAAITQRSYSMHAEMFSIRTGERNDLR